MVRLPTKREPNQLGASRLSAERRLRAIERRLERDPELKVQHHNFMKKHEELDHRDLMNSHRGKNRHYGVPHHSVFKAPSSTTKTRVIFNRSAKRSNGTQLHNGFHRSQLIDSQLRSTTPQKPWNAERYQLPRCGKSTSRPLQDASIIITDGNSTGFLVH